MDLSSARSLVRLLESQDALTESCRENHLHQTQDAPLPATGQALWRQSIPSGEPVALPVLYLLQYFGRVDLFMVADAQTIAKRLEKRWNQVGVVSALVATMAVTMNVVSTRELGDERKQLGEVFIVVNTRLSHQKCAAVGG